MSSWPLAAVCGMWCDESNQSVSKASPTSFPEMPPPTLHFFSRYYYTFSVSHPFPPSPYSLQQPTSHIATITRHTSPDFSTSTRHTHSLLSPQVTPPRLQLAPWPRSPRCRTQARTSRNDAAARCCRGRRWCLTVICSVVCRCMQRMGSCCRR